MPCYSARECLVLLSRPTPPGFWRDVNKSETVANSVSVTRTLTEMHPPGHLNGPRRTTLPCLSIQCRRARNPRSWFIVYLLPARARGLNKMASTPAGVEAINQCRFLRPGESAGELHRHYTKYIRSCPRVQGCSSGTVERTELHPAGKRAASFSRSRSGLLLNHATSTAISTGCSVKPDCTMSACMM